MSIVRFVTVLLAGTTLIGLSAGAAHAQEAEPMGLSMPLDLSEEEQDDSRRQGLQWDVTLSPYLGVLHDNDFDVNSLGLGLRARTRPRRDTVLTLNLSYTLDDYDFGSSFLAGAWSDIHTISMSAAVAREIENDVTIFGGPVIQFSREDGADWSDSFTGGGYVGASVRVSDSLLLGGGIGVISQIEEDARLYPIVILNWEITDDLRLTTDTKAASSIRSGAELVWDPGDVEFAVGLAYDFRRFRLDDTGPGPEGVGQFETVPLYLRVSIETTANILVTVQGGFATTAEAEFADRNDMFLGKIDYDGAFMLGVSAQMRF